MKYIYTSDNCTKCVELKKQYQEQGIEYIERDAARIKLPQDKIDQEAMIEASMNNMELPIIVDWEGK